MVATEEKANTKLTPERINQIENETKRILLDIYGDIENIKIPVNLSSIIQKHDLKVLTGSFPDQKVIGAYDRNSKTIYIEQKDEPQKQTFTIAHELGHFFLHKDKENDVFFRESLDNMNHNNDLLEKEANCFAASLLMPTELISKFWELTKDINAIAKIFGVSYTAAKWRLHNLGLS